MSGKIKLIIGCMFSGKSTHLINDMTRYKIAKKNCLIVKHEMDSRYDGIAKSKSSIVCNSLIEYREFAVTIVRDLSCIDVAPYDVIGVTECQFYSDLLVVESWADAGKIVICDGLDGDYQKNNFGHIHLLIPRAEKVIKLSAICILCGERASFSMRTAKTTDLIEIGGADKYIPVCRRCYNKNK
jgi:thymidine kinase